MSDLCVFTANSDDLLIASGKRVGIDVQSYTVPWSDFVDVKLKAAIPFLRSRTEYYAMWVDGHDSIILNGHIADEYRFWYSSQECDCESVVIGAERTCWPDTFRAKEYPVCAPETQPRFLQAGGFIGPRELLITTLLTVLDCATDGDDMRAWTTAYLSGRLPYLRIDSSRFIFCNEGDGDTEKATPCVRHWNGKVAGRKEFWEKLTQ